MKLIHILLLLMLLFDLSAGICDESDTLTTTSPKFSDEGINAPLFPNNNRIAHKIIETGGSLKTIQDVVANGANLSAQNRQGETPFLSGYIHRVDLETIKFMSQKDPQVIYISTYLGKHALLLGLRHQHPLDVIQFTYSLHPEAIMIPDSDDRLPAHYIFRYRNDLDVKKFIIKLYPEALDKRDVYGKTPLDYARKYKKKNPNTHTKIMRFINNLRKQINGKENQRTMTKLAHCQQSFTFTHNRN